MPESPFVIVLDSKRLNKAFKRAAGRLGPSKMTKLWRQFMLKETGTLKRSLSILISREGPLGVTKGWRKFINFNVVSTGNFHLGAVFHDNVKYKDVVEFGRRPGQMPPPPAELVPWMRKKGKMDNSGTPNQVFSRWLYHASQLAVLIGKRGTFQPGDPNLKASPGPGMQQYARTMAHSRVGIQERAADRLLKMAQGAFDGPA